MKKIVTLIALLISNISCLTSVYAQNVGVDVATPVEKLDVLGAIRIGTTANTNAGTIRWNSPNFQGYDGTQWVNFGGGTLTGSGTATRVAFWSGTSALSSSANLYWDNTNSRLGVGLTNPLGVLSAGSTFGNKVLAYDDGTNASGLGIQAGALQMFTSNNTSNIVFGYGSSGSFTENMRIMGTGNVGIGTTTPASKLQVFRSSPANNTNVFGFGDGAGKGYLTAGGSYIAISTNDGVARIGISNSGPTNGSVGIGLTTPVNNLDVEGGMAVGATYSGTNTAPTNGAIIEGNVGIGTTAPAQKLDVNGKIQMRTGAATGYVPVSDANGVMTWTDPTTLTTSYVDEIRDADNDTKIQVEESADEDIIRFDAAGTQLYSMRKMAGGSPWLEVNSTNTLIGSTISTAINGSGTYNTAVGYQAAQNLTTGQKNTYYGDNAGGSNTTGHWNTMIGTVAGQFNDGGTTNTMVGGYAGRNNLTGSGNVFLGFGAGENETGSNKLYIDNSNTTSPLIQGDFSTNILTLNGNVGIGTTSPSGPIHVNTSTAGRYMRYHDFGNLSLYNPNGSPAVELRLGEAWGRPGLYSSVQLELQSGATGIVFGNNNVEYMRMTAAGSVGIGTTTPGNKLDVVGGSISSSDNYYIGNTGGTGTTPFRIDGSSNKLYILAENGADGSASGTEIRFRTATTNSAASDRMTIINNGNVGIGTTTPAQVLDVNGKIQMRTGAATGYVPVSDANGTMTWTDPATVVSGQAWKLTGNASTVDGTNFIGTTDNVPFNFKVNGEKSGRIASSGETFLGYQAGNLNTSNYSTGIGYQALYNNTGNDNTAVGREALKTNTSGRQNTAVGKDALLANSTGIFNSALGYQSLAQNGTGSYNTAVGVFALNSNTGSNGNSAFGNEALRYSTSAENVGMGANTLGATTTGGSNTAIGTWAGDGNTTGSSNTFLGHNTDASANNLSNATAVGAGATVNASNKVQIGNGSVTAVQLGTGTNVTLETGLVKITGGTPGANKVLTSDAAGLASWVDPNTLVNGDNLGNHTATATLQLNNNWLSNDGGSEGIRIDNSGNIGIGEAAPSGPIHVNTSTAGRYMRYHQFGNLSLYNPNGSPAVELRLGEAWGRPGLSSSVQLELQSGTTGIIFGNNNVEYMRMTSAGNVGIGTTTPGNKLDVVGGSISSSGDYFIGNTSGTGTTPFRIDGFLNALYIVAENGADGSASGTEIRFRTASTNSSAGDVMTINKNGNVGIGTTAPGAYLDITGTNAGTTSLQLRSGNTGVGTSSNQITFGYSGTETYRHTIKTRHNNGGAANNAIDFYVWKYGTDAAGTVGTQQVMTIDGGNGGSVGIGTTAPSANLDVVGSTKTTQLQVGANGSVVSQMQAGTVGLGANVGGGVLVVTVNFPAAFSSAPKVICTVRTETGQTYTDTFSVTTKEISTTSFKVNIHREDSDNAGWGQSLNLDWIAVQ